MGCLHQGVGGRIGFVAFNRHIAEELQTRLPPSAPAMTLHALGFAAVQRAFPGVQLDEAKLTKLAKQAAPNEFPSVRKAAEQLCRLMKYTLTPGPSPTALDSLCEHYGVEVDERDREKVYGLAGLLLDRSRAWTDVVDFDDMVWFPHARRLPVDGFDLLLVDEAQDLNRAQQALARAATASGRLVPVGDRNQAIYGFSGADCDALPRLLSELEEEPHGCQALPLTVTWRCPTSHVELARRIVPKLEAAPNAAEGEVRTQSLREIATAVRPGDLVIGRRNAPLVGLTYRLVLAGVPAVMRGREIGKGLLALVARLKPDSISDLVDRIEDYREREESRLTRKGAPQSQREALNDRCDCLGQLAAQCTSLEQLEVFIQSRFDDGAKPGEAVVLSSVHRCVHPDTLVETPEGLRPIRAISDFGTVATPNGSRPYQGRFSLPTARALRITTRSGYSVTVTPEHGLTVWGGIGEERREAQFLREGDVLRLRLGCTIDPAELPRTPPPPSGRSRAERYRLPDVLSHQLAEFLGLMVADGTIYERGFRLIKRHPSVIERFCSLVWSAFGVEGKTIDHQGTPGVDVYSAYLADWLLSIDGLAPNKKAVPGIILAAPLRIQASFLRGLFEDGTVNVRGKHVDHVHWENRDRSVVEMVQTMLLRFGIISAVRANPRIFSLYAYGQNAKRFGEAIGFVADEKNARLRGTYGPETRYLIPVTGEEIRALRPWLLKHEADNAMARGYVSRHTAALVLSRTECASWEARLEWHYEPIRSIESMECESVCLTVPDGNRFLQNGFDGWNSKGLEAPTVYVLDTKSLPLFRRNQQPWEMTQERNLAYAAVTRSKSVLVFEDEIPAIFAR